MSSKGWVTRVAIEFEVVMLPTLAIHCSICTSVNSFKS